MASSIRVSTFVCVLLLALALVSSARYTSVSFSEEEMLSEKGRSLKVSLADYGETSANTGHDPSSSKVRGHHSGGRHRRRRRSHRRG
ncbi:hypothetical protein LINGRAHAP2_LOCUS6032 [Linum grandiflorum]